MAEPDDNAPDAVTAGTLPDADQLELEALAALRGEMLKNSTPSAARVAAAKTLLEWSREPGNRTPGPQDADPGIMDLDDIDRELRLLSR